MELKAAKIDVMKSHIELEKEAKTEELKIMRERIELDKDVMKSHAASEVKKLMAEMETIELDNNKNCYFLGWSYMRRVYPKMRLISCCH